MQTSETDLRITYVNCRIADQKMVIHVRTVNHSHMSHWAKLNMLLHIAIIQVALHLHMQLADRC